MWLNNFLLYYYLRNISSDAAEHAVGLSFPTKSPEARHWRERRIAGKIIVFVPGRRSTLSESPRVIHSPPPDVRACCLDSCTPAHGCPSPLQTWCPANSHQRCQTSALPQASEPWCRQSCEDVGTIVEMKKGQRIQTQNFACNWEKFLNFVLLKSLNPSIWQKLLDVSNHFKTSKTYKYIFLWNQKRLKCAIPEDRLKVHPGGLTFEPVVQDILDEYEAVAPFLDLLLKRFDERRSAHRLRLDDVIIQKELGEDKDEK